MSLFELFAVLCSVAVTLKKLIKRTRISLPAQLTSYHGMGFTKRRTDAACDVYKIFKFHDRECRKSS